MHGHSFRVLGALHKDREKYVEASTATVVFCWDKDIPVDASNGLISIVCMLF